MPRLESGEVAYDWCMERIAELQSEREAIIALCNRYAQPGVNTDTHRVCYEILKILGEREDGR